MQDDGIKVVKEAIASDEFITKHFKAIKPDIVKAHMVIAHTRAWTQGHPNNNNNNHPVASKQYVMVHNGTCSLMDRIKGYPYKGTVDSEVLLSYVERDGIEKGLAELRGTASVAIFDSKDKRGLWLWRHGNPLVLGYNERLQSIFFGSTEAIMEEGLSDLLNFFTSFHMRETAEDWLYSLQHTPLKISCIKEIEPKKLWVQSWAGKNFSELTEWRARHDANNKPPVNTEDTGNVNEAMKLHGSDKIYLNLLKLKWDREKRRYTGEAEIETPKEGENRYYFNGASKDFTNWQKLKGGGHISLDRKLVKFWDAAKRAHFLTTLDQAVNDGLVLFETGGNYELD